MKKAIMILSILFIPSSVFAETSNFDLAGRLYTKWLYRNNDSMGILSYGNPFWPDDIAGDNGVGTEFELQIFGRVSRYVQAYARLQSRFGALWQDWWESGERKPEYQGVENTSGDSLGMNRAAYIKLRGTYVRAAIPIPTIDWVTVGSSDLGMFNPWTIGKVRYIDRDNGKGIFIDGHKGSFQYSLAMIALPKLWVGPWWSTGVGDPSLTRPFYSQDWAYGVKVSWSPVFSVGGEDWSNNFTLISTLTNDIEVDRTDPDAVGSKYPNCTDDLGNTIIGCKKDHAVDYHTRYLTSVTTFEAQMEPFSWLSANLFGGYSIGRVDKNLTANGVEQNQGVFPIVYKDTNDLAVKARLDFSDPFGIGLSIKAEYFNIGAEWNSIFGARREADVLLTDGFIEGGQLPTLNLANEFIDFDESFVESCIGWHGGTFVLEQTISSFLLSLEGSYIGYNTNGQNWDVDKTYPDFLHTDGYTDTDLYDYANSTDRGRDPRSVYRKNQDRRTIISVLNAKYNFDVGGGLDFSLKSKFIYDKDFRSHTTTNDDYTGFIQTHRLKVGYNALPGLRFELGGQFDYWKEDNRKGTLELGYGDDRTWKAKGFAGLSYEFEGIKFRYYFEYLHKYQDREREVDQRWKVFRSKASLEVAW